MKILYHTVISAELADLECESSAKFRCGAQTEVLCTVTGFKYPGNRREENRDNERFGLSEAACKRVSDRESGLQ